MNQDKLINEQTTIQKALHQEIDTNRQFKAIYDQQVANLTSEIHEFKKQM